MHRKHLTQLTLGYHRAKSNRYTKDKALGKNAAAFSIMADGIPIVYAGQEQQFSGAKDPENREALWLSGYNTKSELYTLISKANGIRNHAIKHNKNYVTSKVCPALLLWISSRL